MYRPTFRLPITRATALFGALAFVAACNESGEPTSARPTAPAAATVSTDAARAFSLGDTHPVSLDVFAPEDDHHVGIGGSGWFVDMEIEFPNKSLAQTGFTGFQLTGPGGHINIAPFPRADGAGHDESNPSLLVVCSTATGPAKMGQNLAGLFNLTGVTNLTPSESELWATWIIAAPPCGSNTKTLMAIGIVDDLNHDGIYNDAPDIVPDANGDGRITLADVRAIPFASNLVIREFFINP